MQCIAAGIVLYNPETERLKENVATILPQVERLYFVDNGSDNIGDVKILYADEEKIRIYENPRNEGIARALNQLCETALNDGFDWLLTLDQDSVAETNLIESYRNYVDMDGAAIIAPRVVDDNEAEVISSSALPDCEEISRCNTSASLTNLRIWREVGGFDEKMFIDCVDFDYCTNVILHGYHIIRDNRAVLHHRLGKAREIRFFMPVGKLLHNKKLMRPVYTYCHSPERTYYYARNIRYYMAKYKGKIDEKTERRVYRKWVVLKLLFEPMRFRKLRAILRGRRDAKKLIRQQ